MDFFGEQDRARKQSFALLAIFSAVMLGYALVIHTIISFLVGFVMSGSTLLKGGQSSNLTGDQVALIITASLCGLVLYGCWSRYNDVRGGGRLLAQRFGASHIENQVIDRAERCLLGVAAEMSVAASIPCPAIFCLKSESAINAFVVGSGDDMALVVSQGVLDNLDREELLGVVAHEFGHLANGDLAYNMRLLVVLGGLNSLDEFGKELWVKSRSRSSRRSEIDRSTGMFYFAAGAVVRLIGCIGVLAGTIVKASFSRQREYLADASAVQFTRNTYGLAAALEKVRERRGGPALYSSYSQALAHMCFHNPASSWFLGPLFNTHPPVERRIDAIDKHFSVKLRQRKARSKRLAEVGTNAGSSGAVNGHQVQAVGFHKMGLSDNVIEVVKDTTSSQAILCALFISRQGTQVDNDYSALRFAFTTEFSDSVKRIRGSLGEELDKNKLRIIDLIIPTLKQEHESTLQSLLINIEKLIDSDSGKSLEKIATLQIVRRKLALSGELFQAESIREISQSSTSERRPISELGKELALLLSIMVKASGHGSDRVNDEYLRVLKCYTNEHYPLRSVEEDGVLDEIHYAFQELLQQPFLQRKTFVQHCSEIMQYDGISMAEELALINLFAVSLDVPELAVA